MLHVAMQNIMFMRFLSLKAVKNHVNSSYFFSTYFLLLAYLCTKSGRCKKTLKIFLLAEEIFLSN